MNNSLLYTLLRNSDIFADLTDEQVTNISTASTYMQYKRGEKIYRQSSSPTHVYLIDSGSVKLASTTTCGKTLIKSLLYEGELFGENIFAKKSLRSNYAETASVTKVIMIPVHTFKAMVMGNPQFATSIMNMIIQRLELLDQRMQNFVFKKAKTRILDFIVNAARKRGIKIGVNECLINHGMSHKEIAYLTDTSRQTVARVLGELKRENVIHFSARKPGKILIRNFSAE